MFFFSIYRHDFTQHNIVFHKKLMALILIEQENQTRLFDLTFDFMYFVEEWFFDLLYKQSRSARRPCTSINEITNRNE